MEDVTAERGERIKKDYTGYLKIPGEQDAARRLSRIVGFPGDVQSVISATVRNTLHAYPEPVTQSLFGRSSVTPKDHTALMAVNARNDAVATTKKYYDKHRTALIAGEEAQIWPEPARFIVTIAKTSCFHVLEEENCHEKDPLRWFNEIVSDSQKPGGSRFVIRPMTHFFGKQSKMKKIGLSVWDRQEDDTKRGRVRELLERTDEVRSQENFNIWHIASRKDMEELMAEALGYSGTAISEPNFRRFLKHCCRIDIMHLDDAGEQADARINVERQVIGDSIAHDLFDELTSNQRAVLQLRHYEKMSFKQIAVKLNITPVVADGRYREAIKALKKAASENGIVMRKEKYINPHLEQEGR